MEEYHTTHEWDDDQSLAHTIIEALAAVREMEPTELEPLHSVVDLEAYERLVTSLHDSTHANGNERVEFRFDGHRVIATSKGKITVRRQPSGRPDGSVRDEAAFANRLADLVQEAAANGVDVEGGWRDGVGSHATTHGIEIYEVERTKPL